MDYVVFDLEYLYHMANMIRSNVGSIFSVCFHLFLLVTCVFVIPRIVTFFLEHFE